MSVIKISIFGSGLLVLSSLSAFTYLYCQKKLKSRSFSSFTVTTSDLSKGDNHRYRKHIRSIVELIDKSTRSVYITMYLFTIRDFSSSLIRAQQRGVDVKVILDGTMMNCMGSQKGKLGEGGIEVRYNKDLNFLIHHKFCLIDSDSTNWVKDFQSDAELPLQGVVVTGSQNWTRQATTGNWEYQLYTCNQAIVRRFHNEFMRMWEIFAP